MDGLPIYRDDLLSVDPLLDMTSDNSRSSNDDDKIFLLILMAMHIYLTARDSLQAIELS